MKSLTLAKAATPATLMLATLALATLIPTPAQAAPIIPVAGLVPPLGFTMTDAATGKTVTAAAFRGKTVLVYFGYTNCTDECPDTLQIIHRVLAKLGTAAAHTILLFVTVDPARDTTKILNTYLPAFDPHFVGLRGTANQVYKLTRRYRVVATVHPSPDPKHYQVVHSALTYVFGPHGNARFIIPDPSLTPHPNIAAIAAAIAPLAAASHAAISPHRGPLAWLSRLG